MGRGLFTKLRRKLAAADGETLVETLVATLIMALVMLMLCTAIVSAAKINASADETNSGFSEAIAKDPSVGNSSGFEMTLTIYHNTVGGEPSTLSTSDNNIDAYSMNGYVFYEPVSSN